MLAPVAVGAGLAGAAHAAPPHRGAGPQLTSEQMVVFDCPGVPQPLVRPSSYTLTCGDGGAVYDKIDWTSWTPKIASASATLSLNTCVPDCAAGHYRYYPALLVLWGSSAVKGHPGELAYTKMTAILPAARPSGVQAVSTSNLPVY
jgi:hypothetical protein